MGAALQILNADATHINAQSQIDNARRLQTAHNSLQMTLAEAKRTVQTANNAASLSYAESQRKVQTANNDAETIVRGAQTRLQTAGNAASASVTAAKQRVQATFNAQAIQLAEAKKVLQAERNKASAVTNDVALWSTSLANQSRMTAAGKQIGQIEGNINATLDGATTGRAYDRIAMSEALGSSIAQAAGMGVGGSTVEAYNGAMRLREGLKEDMNDRALAQKLHYARQSQGDTLRSGVDGMASLDKRAQLDHDVIIADQDNTAILDGSNYDPVYANQDYSAITAHQDFEVFSPDIDYTVYTDHKKMSGFQQVASFIGAGVATYFGGPSAGMAVLDASQGINDMQNGNMQAAQHNFDNAFTSGYKGFQTYEAPGKGGSSWWSNITSKPATGANLKG